MLRPLVIWVTHVMQLRLTSYGSLDGGYEIDVELLQEFETATRRSKSLLPVLRQSNVPGLYEAMAVEEFLDFVDFLVFHTQRLGWEAKEYRDALELLLRDSGV